MCGAEPALSEVEWAPSLLPAAPSHTTYIFNPSTRPYRSKSWSVVKICQLRRDAIAQIRKSIANPAMPRARQRLHLRRLFVVAGFERRVVKRSQIVAQLSER